MNFISSTRRSSTRIRPGEPGFDSSYSFLMIFASFCGPPNSPMIATM
jgi:hypothetical protein